MAMNLVAGNPYGYLRLMRAVQDNSVKLAVYAVFFWTLARSGAADSRELLKRVGMHERYLTWQQQRLWNLALKRAGSTSTLLLSEMQKLKAPFELTQYVTKVNSAINARKVRLKMIKWYTLMMKAVFDSIMVILREPMYLFDVAIAIYCLPRFEQVLKTLLNVLRQFARWFKPSRRLAQAEAQE